VEKPSKGNQDLARVVPSSSLPPSTIPGELRSSPHLSDSQITISDPLLAPSRAKQRTSSPAYVRERPFRLNLSKKHSASEKGKGKVGDPPMSLGDTTPGSSPSAKKSLNFDLDPSSKITTTPSSVNHVVQVPSPPGKRLSWYEMKVEEDEANARALGAGPDTILAAKFSQVVSFASPVVDVPALPDRQSHSPPLSGGSPQAEWDKNLNPLSEALNLDWTAEDEAAYHALEPPFTTGEEDVAGKNTLRIESHVSSLERLETQSSISLASTQRPTPSKVLEGATENGGDVENRDQLLSLDGLLSLEIDFVSTLGGPKKGVKKKRAETHSRKGNTTSGKVQSSLGLLVNLASKKIQNVKGRSPSKRLLLKGGASKSRAAKRPSSAPRSSIFPSSKVKSPGSIGGSVGSMEPPDTNP